LKVEEVCMAEPRIVSHEEWLKARTALMAKEKKFTRLRDELARERRAMAWARRHDRC
jgi:predicted dithiol-disulfide oxidoreductase (DUF899 family)